MTTDHPSSSDHPTSSDRPGRSDQPGRQIRLTPVAPGLWLILLGAGAMVLGPLFGFLIGSMLGTDRETWGLSPIYLFLFLGFIVAGLGLGLALFGARHHYRHRMTA